MKINNQSYLNLDCKLFDWVAKFNISDPWQKFSPNIHRNTARLREL